MFLGFITAILCFILIEICLGYLLWIRKAEVYSTSYYTASKIYYRFFGNESKIKTSFLPKSMYTPDTYLGYSDLSGKYFVTLSDITSGRSHSFHVTIGPDGNRVTSKFPKKFEGKSEIWIFGDSYTNGWANNDETTFPFFLQNMYPNYKVINYAKNGYGNIHAYLQIRKEAERKNAAPKIVLIVYGDYFNRRNVAAPSRIRQYKHNKSSWQNFKPSDFFHPKGTLEGDKLRVEYVPLFCEVNKFCNDPDPSKEYQEEVTKMILKKIYEIGEKLGAEMVLSFIRGQNDDEVVSFASNIGYTISDIRPVPQKNEWDNFSPFDGHPGPLAQNNYAIKISNTINQLLN